jgi:hypothetical protein
VHLDTAAHLVNAGDVIRGLVTTRGGKLDQTGALLIHIREVWYTVVYNPATKTGMQQTHSHRHGETLLSEALTLRTDEAGEEFRFALTMPPDGALQHEWAVEAVFDVPGTGDASATASFLLATPAPIQGLLDAITTVAPFEVSIHNDGNEYTADLKPTGEVKKDFDGVRLVVTWDRDQDRLAGILHINPQDHTLQEHMQSLLRLNNRTEPFELPVASVMTDDNREAIATLRSLLYKSPSGE